ncbi:hypothetical protein ACT4S5_18575 [Kocuria oceani]|uniref:hypothetical protein n=1 Tax=Kocuria oceani TaxID=988827 RepID=UPI0040358002
MRRFLPTSHVFYEKAWLTETGIFQRVTAADGTKTYQPDSKIRRDQMAAFLFRMAAVH